MNDRFREHFREIETQLQQVDEFLIDIFDNFQECVRENLICFLNAGGKRVRPALTLLAARYGKKDINTILPLAAAVELIHMASLVHDDIIDNSKLRRGKPTIRAENGNNFALNFGDILFTKALTLVNEYNNPQINQLLAKASMEMSKGEMKQILSAYDLNLSVKEYLYRIKRKTSYLIAYSCEVGALASGADIITAKILSRYGHYIGMSYQIIDDILDFTAEEESMGKPVGSDLRQGIITIPVILALKEDEGSLRSKLYKSYRNNTSEGIDDIVNNIKETGNIKKSKKLADTYVYKALRELELLPQNIITDSLSEIALYIQRRQY